MTASHDGVPSRHLLYHRSLLLHYRRSPRLGTDMTVEIYIAGKYLAQARLRAERERLRVMGYLCDSHWLDQVEQGYAITTERALEEAARDLHQVQRADWIILDTQDPSDTGGREVELGIALGGGKWFIRIGPVRNIFHHLANEVFESWDEFFTVTAPVVTQDCVG